MNALRLSLVLLLLLAAGAPLRAQPSPMQGVYTLDLLRSEDVHAAIDRAVAPLNFIVRPIARSRLRKTNEPYRRVTLDFTPGWVSLRRDDLAAIRTPADGEAVRWRREDGEVLDVSTVWEGGVLRQTFVAEDGRRVNEFSLNQEGDLLTMQVTVTSPRLEEPVRYRVVYRRTRD